MDISTYIIAIFVLVILWGIVICCNLKINSKCDYIVIFIFTLFFGFTIVMEYSRVLCDNCGCEYCGDGLSSDYNQYLPDSTTTSSEAYQNLEKSINFKYILWRKYVITIALFLLFFVMFKQFSLTISDFMFIYFALFVLLVCLDCFYQYHYYDHFRNVENQNLQIIKNTYNL